MPRYIRKTYRLQVPALIWVFPTLCLIYGVTHWWVGRRYGGVGCG
jgi:hypothetical protein